jgi:hypothetical protein
LQGNLSIERMCQLAQVSRAGFYRYLHGPAPAEQCMTVRSAVQEIALEHRRRYGYRRVTAELRRRGMMVNLTYVRLRAEFVPQRRPSTRKRVQGSSNFTFGYFAVSGAICARVCHWRRRLLVAPRGLNTLHSGAQRLHRPVVAQGQRFPSSDRHAELPQCHRSLEHASAR